jgi:hypothetical protein
LLKINEKSLFLFNELYPIKGSWDSAVDIATGLGARFFSSPYCPDWFSVHPFSCPMGTRGSFPRNKAARVWR